ncbi:MAG: hypothetical protein LBL79_03655 [Prevotella sp.]|jgi:hypothetical protein|nr:hypothetical protein [Prevotella sp.]
MIKYICLFTLILLAGCSPKTLKTGRYKGSDKIVYEKMFMGKLEVEDKNTIDEIVNLLGTAKKGPSKFIVKEQLFFIKNNDTLTIRKSETFLQNVDGSFQLDEQTEEKLMKLFGK